MNTARTRFLSIVAAGFGVMGLGCVTGPGWGPNEAMAQAPDVKDAPSLLRALERSDEDLRAITANVQYARHFKLQGDRHTRQGELYFMSMPRPGKRDHRVFSIEFETLIIDDVRREDPQRWTFDGEWLVEAREAEKMFIKRRVALPDDNFDPLKIGEGPMPIPIGQKAEDILARYEAELRDPRELFGNQANAALEDFVEDTVHIVLTPRERFREQEDLQEIRLWYRWDSQTQRWLPRLARTLNRAGDLSYVQLINVQVARDGDPAGSIAIPPRVFDTTPPGEGWDVELIDDLGKGAG
ncbi:MAG: hypothetical protein VYC34_10190 [Planctomycetota bacterium]|nr:hypothetical protein [Planctomycetota bacterium]